MEQVQLLSIIYDYGGLVIGLVLLVVACMFLPGKIRWYVLTAGLTLIVFRAYQIYNARKKLAEADAEREQLRDKHKELQDWLDKLRSENESLRDEKNKIEAERDRIQKEMAELDTATDSNLQKKKELDAKVNQLLEEGRATEQKRSQQLSAIQKTLELQRQFSNLAGETGNE